MRDEPREERELAPGRRESKPRKDEMSQQPWKDAAEASTMVAAAAPRTLLRKASFRAAVSRSKSRETEEAKQVERLSGAIAQAKMQR
jgi:hypothetical protein